MPIDMFYSVYLTQPIKNEYALILITTGQEGNTYRSEYFILMKSPDHQVFSERYCYHDVQSLKTHCNFDLKLVEEDTLFSVQTILDSFLFKKYEADHDNFWINRRFKPEKIENYRLIMFAMHGLFPEGLNFVLHNTNCRSLSDYLYKALELKRIVKMNQMTSNGT